MDVPLPTLNLPVVNKLINEFSDAARLTAGEQHDGYTIPPELAEVEAAETEPVVAELISVANDLHVVFAEPEMAIVRLNKLLDQHSLTRRLDPSGRLVWCQLPGADPIAGAVVARIVDEVAERGIKAMGTCSGHQCVDVYVDTSQASNRAYCSKKCNDRARVARWRARHDD